MSGTVPSKTNSKRAGVLACSFIFIALALSPFLGQGCSLAETRPSQEMSYTAAAIRAAKEVGADTAAPGLFRRANEAFFKARNEYRLKNFVVAREYAENARRLAEEAEYEALRQGARRTSTLTDDTPRPVASPYPYPTPTGVPAFVIDRQAAPPAAAPP